MQLETLLVLLSIATFGCAENTVESDDVPSACLPACQFTIDLTARCDGQTDDDDEYLPCVCGAANSRALLTECASCVRDNGRSDPDDNDVADLMDDCGWDFDDADSPYPTGWSTTSAVTPPSTTSVVVPTSSDTVTVTETPSETPSVTPTSSLPNSVTNSPTSIPTGSMAGALKDRIIVGPLLAGLIMGLPAIL
ncbi:hypothetical protein HD806DRAFT_492424 [Xylariaceae sp. AK1471]|nr:hypothetical protein HD806DRAFT_492424 [Xylariaceae sp. AK1471]